MRMYAFSSPLRPTVAKQTIASVEKRGSAIASDFGAFRQASQMTAASPPIHRLAASTCSVRLLSAASWSPALAE